VDCAVFISSAAKMISQKTADQRRQTEKKLIAFKPEAATLRQGSGQVSNDQWNAADPPSPEAMAGKD
jgi:hypothetical protein